MNVNYELKVWHFSNWLFEDYPHQVQLIIKDGEITRIPNFMESYRADIYEARLRLYQMNIDHKVEMIGGHRSFAFRTMSDLVLFRMIIG